MEHNRIRAVFVGKEPDHAMRYIVDNEHKVIIGGKPEKRKISQIIEDAEHFFVYLSNAENESMMWRKIPKNECTTVEFEIE